MFRFFNNKKDISKLSLNGCRDFIINTIDSNCNNVTFLNNFIINNNLLKSNYNITNITSIERYLNNIYIHNSEIIQYLNDINNKLENSVYGHTRSKNI